MRQSILIHRKLETERLDADAPGRRRPRRGAATSEFVPRHIKRVRIRTAITRHVWNELEDEEEAELFRDDLNARLDELEGEDDFLDTPIDDLIAALCRDLGFEPPEPPPRPIGRTAAPSRRRKRGPRPQRPRRPRAQHLLRSALA